MYEELVDYFKDEGFLNQIKSTSVYKRTVEKARGQQEIREYYQTNDIKWTSEKKCWKGLKTIGMLENTIIKGDKKTRERRYYISSENVEIELFLKCTMGHWAIESMHWHLDVTFKEDQNKAQEKIANQNLTIMRRWSLSILKMVELTQKNLV